MLKKAADVIGFWIGTFSGGVLYAAVKLSPTFKKHLRQTVIKALEESRIGRTHNREGFSLPVSNKALRKKIVRFITAHGRSPNRKESEEIAAELIREANRA